MEIFVASVCLKGYCDGAMSSYYVYNPAFKDRTDEIVTIVSNSISPYVRDYVVPTTGFLLNKKLSYPISKDNNVFIEFKETTTLGVSLHF